MRSALDPRCWVVVLTRLAVAVLIAFIAYCVLWRVQGGEWERVESPSMGTQAPVGSLLWVEPVDFEALQVGDFVTVRPPGSQTTYSHLVHALNDDGTITTKGVIPGPDPWALTADDVVGGVRHAWWGVGWLVAAAPVLLVGGLVVGSIRALLEPAWRLPAVLVLGSLVASIAITIHQPFVNAQELGFVARESGGADATYVGTGLLPIRLEVPHGGPTVTLHDGEVGSVHVSADRAADDGELSVRLSPAVPWWWYAPLVAACFAPALGSTLRDRRRGNPGPTSAAGFHRRPRAAFP